MPEEARPFSISAKCRKSIFEAQSLPGVREEGCGARGGDRERRGGIRRGGRRDLSFWRRASYCPRKAGVSRRSSDSAEGRGMLFLACPTTGEKLSFNWYYESNGERRGPFSPGTLKKLAESGEVTAETRVWREGLAEPVKAGVVRGLFPSAPQTVLSQSAEPVVAPVPPPAASPPVESAASQPQASQSTPVAGRDWHYSINGEKLGPVTSAELKRLADSGTLSPSDLIWREGLASWVVASNVKGLFSEATSTRTPRSMSSSIPPELPSMPPPLMTATTAATSSSAGVAGNNSSPLHVQRIGIAIAAFLGGLATFMPWAHLPILGAVDGTVGDGWITLALFAVAVGVSFSGNRGQPLGSWPQVAAIVLPAIAGIIGVWKIIQINGIASDLRSNADAETLGGAMAGLAAQAIQPKFGLYMLVMAGLATASAAIVLHPQRLVFPSRIPSLDQLPFLRRISLPLHPQRIVVVLLSLVGAAAVFMPWLQAVDSDAVFKINAALSTPAEIMEARAINMKYATEMGRQMSKKVERLGDAQSVTGASVPGVLTGALFLTALAFCLYGIRTRPLAGWVRLCVIIPPLIASGIALFEFLRVGSRDQAVRTAVQEFVRERGHDIEVNRLKQPVLKAGVGLRVAIITGIVTAAAVPLLASTKTSQE